MKYNTVITEANEGNHSPHQTKLSWQWIDDCTEKYRSARLYHVVFANLKEHATCAGYINQKAVLKDLMQKLKRKGMNASYRAAREVDEKKGEHLHVYICVEASEKIPDGILNRIKNGWLSTYTRKRGLQVYLNEPKDPMHSGNSYISLPKSKPNKIADAKIWVSYLHKARSKPSRGEIYTASRGEKRNSQKLLH